MSVILEYAMRSDELVLAQTLASGDIRLDVERVTALDPECPVLFTWVGSDDLDGFEAAARDDPTVTDITVLSEVDGKRLYSMQLTDETDLVLYPAWVKLGGEGLEASFADGWWHSRVRFPSRDAVSSYHGFLEEHDVEFRLQRLYESDGAERDGAGLTPEQHDTLKLAYERGYFEVPRRVTTNELAAELGVSDQAVSERLRRGYARLVEHVVGVERE
ncbi:helix-turn-helix domain-containing protein [Halorarius litoreus]|uniref:helix-turn-helix domain-containing protein n=1 Tax=Halorarius litoreus TaxID=2962676 RepID=UPI0020CE0BCC|nr:helix-turn-helix domain-containing protein [Halorarius litoreus]